MKGIYSRIYVAVQASFSRDGLLMPREILWTDGRRYPIDRVTEIRQAAAMKAGGQGDRYTIWIGGSMRYLFFERSNTLSGNHLGRWFVEKEAC